MNCLPVVTNDHVEGELAGWARKRLRKRVRSKEKFQMWWQSWIAETDFTLSLESHLTESENTCANIMKCERFIKSSQWPPYGLSSAMSWCHGVPSLPSVAQKLIRPIRFSGCNYPYLNFLPCVYWISFSLILSSNIYSSSNSLSSVPFSPYRCRDLSVLQRSLQHNQGMWGKLPLQENISSFSSSLNILCAPLRTHDSSVGKSRWM